MEMETVTKIVGAVALLGYLFLVWNRSEVRGLKDRTKLKFLALWIAIFAGVALVAKQIAG